VDIPPNRLDEEKYYNLGMPELAIDPSLPWARNRQTIQNIIVARKTMVDYPWPFDPSYWIRAETHPFANPNAGAYARMLASGVPVTKEAIRTYITLSIVSLSALINEIIDHDIEAEKRKVKRKMMVTGVVFAVIGVIFSFAGLSAIVLAVFNTMTKTLSGAMAANCVKGLEDIGRNLAGDTSGFGVEVKKLLDLVAAATRASVDAAQAGAPVVNGQLPVPAAPAAMAPVPAPIAPIPASSVAPAITIPGSHATSVSVTPTALAPTVAALGPSTAVIDLLNPPGADGLPTWVKPAAVVTGVAGATFLGIALLGAFSKKNS
jgi:hypothetical protein